VTSQGQRFRRRALRRGYKVDEVDAFLDRVEATLAGDPIGAPVSAQEVHDVVFRVRFGGYDEWQVDLHLDRVERQLAELEERTGYGRSGEQRMVPPPVREDRPPMRDARSGEQRMVPPPMRDDRPPMRDDRPPMAPMPPMPDERTMRPMAPPPPHLPGRPMSPVPMPSAPPPPGYGRYEEPMYDGFEAGRHGRSDMTTEIRMGDMSTAAAPAGLTGDALRVDQLRRTFQVRRFGSGYERAQVDRLFEGLVDLLAGRAQGGISDADLDPGQFALVSGGYFEAEVDAALKEVRDILMRRR
jgi:DivIVA domain-containing protein